MTVKTIGLGLAFIALACPALAQAPNPLEGVWTRVGVTVVTDQGPHTNTNLQSSLYIFTREFFSVMYVNGSEPRPLRGPRGKSQLSPAEKIAEYAPFVAYSGTYEIDGSTITFRPLVALNPSFMAGGFRTDELAIDGSALWLIMKPLGGGPIKEIRTKLVRLESEPGALGSRIPVE